MIQIHDWVFEFHGHKCPAMPIGYRAGLAAMKQLGVERASNKELFMVCENGPAHATACFLDGVMAATGCTYGSGHFNAKVGLIIAAAVFLGGQIGARISLKTKSQTLKKYFGIFLILIAIWLIYRALS